MRQVRFYGHGKARVAHLTIPFARFKINNYDTECAYEFRVLRDMGYPWEYWPPVKGEKREVFQSERLPDAELMEVFMNKNVSDSDIKMGKSKPIKDIPDGVFKDKKEELALEKEIADKPKKKSLKKDEKPVGETHTKTIIEDSVKGKKTIIGEDNE